MIYFSVPWVTAIVAKNCRVRVVLFRANEH